MPRIPVTFGAYDARSKAEKDRGMTPSFGDEQPTGLQIFKEKMMGERDTMQGLAEQSHQRLRGIEDEFRSAIGGAMQGTIDRIDATTTPIRDDAVRAADEIRERVRAEGTPDILPEVRRRVAQQEFRLNDYASQQAMSMASGTASSIDDQITSLQSQARARGLSPAAVEGQISELRARKNEALSRSLADAGVNFSQVMANLNAQGTSQIIQAAQIEEGQTARQNQQLANAQSLVAAADQLQTSARIAGEQTLAGLAQLYPALGQMAATNPPPFVSEVAGLLSLADLAISGLVSGAGEIAINSAAGVPTRVPRVGVFGPGDETTTEVLL